MVYFNIYLIVVKKKVFCGIKYFMVKLKKVDFDVYIVKKDNYVFYDFKGGWDEIKRNWEDRIVGEG